MRLEVFCEDRIGLTRELLDLLAARSIDLRGIEIDTIGRIYLNFTELDFEIFRQLMAEIRRINGCPMYAPCPSCPPSASIAPCGRCWSPCRSRSFPSI